MEFYSDSRPNLIGPKNKNANSQYFEIPKSK